ncbi:MAG: hypothetical protein KDC02_20175, partial [Flavobacteriales bacterium]|nr:hypothetical protein [Flavobacteriales bacterium]
MNTSEVLVLDLELDRHGNRLLDVGAVMGTSEYHGTKLEGLKGLLARSRFVVGHNLVRHDAPFLRKRWGDEVFKGKDLVDTLGWSALLYADRPYHRLVKGYKLEDEEAENNPLSDAKLCLELLKDLVGRFSGLPEGLKAAFHALLHDQEGYGGLFTLAGHQASAPKALEAIPRHFAGELCDRADLSGMVR